MLHDQPFNASSARVDILFHASIFDNAKEIDINSY